MKLEKMTRRSLAMLLVMMMVFSLAVPAFADTGIADGTAVSEEDHNHNNEAVNKTLSVNASDEEDRKESDDNSGQLISMSESNNEEETATVTINFVELNEDNELIVVNSEKVDKGIVDAATVNEGNNFTAVAAFGGKYYGTIAAAASQITKAGQTVVLVSDVDLANTYYAVRGNTVLDLNGHTVTSSFDYTLMGLSGTSTKIMNGTVKNTKEGNGLYGAICTYKQNGGATLTIENVNASGKYGVIVAPGVETYSGNAVLSGSNNIHGTFAGVVVEGPYNTSNALKSTLIVNEGSVIEGDIYGISGNGSWDNTDITLNGGEITGGSVGIYHPQQGTMTIEDDVTVKGSTGIQICGGELTVNGGVIESIETEYVSNPNKPAEETDGSIQDASALSVVSRAAYGDAKVTVKGGEFKTANSENLSVRKYGFERSGDMWQVMSEEPTHNEINVMRGIFHDRSFETYMSEDSKVVGMDNQLVVTDKDSIAMIGITNYGTLAEAVEAAQNGQTVTLIADTYENIVVNKGQDIIIDLGNNTLSGGTVQNKAALTNFGTVTITGNGTIKREDNGTIGYYVIDNQGEMNIGSGMFTNNSFDGTDGSSLIRNAGGKTAAVLNITGGDFVQNQFITVKNDDLGILNIEGGTFMSDDGVNTINNWSQASISGGNITGDILTSVWSDNFEDSTTALSGSVNVTGNINVTKTADKSGNVPDTTPAVYITDGYYYINDWNVDEDALVRIFGGAYSNNMFGKYIPKGSVPRMTSGDGLWRVAVDDDPIFGSGSAVARIGNIGFADLQEAFDIGGEVILVDNCSQSVVVKAGKSITLELSSYTLSNTEGKDTITVESGGELTIKGDGGNSTVDNTSHGCAAILNNGKVTLLSGNYTRSTENGQSASDNGGNSFYVLLNHGTMIIGADEGSETTGVVNVDGNDGKYSSLIENGYQNYNDRNARRGYVEGINNAQPSLIINSGTFKGGLNNVKNDDGAVLAVNGGDFSESSQYSVLNYNTAQINGGNFEGGMYAVINGGSGSEINSGELAITGGIFVGVSGAVAILENAEMPVISGGTFSHEVAKDFCAEDYYPNKLDDMYSVHKHENVLDENTAVEPTCVKEGREADEVCKICGEVFREGQVIAATGVHTPVSAENGKPATCTEIGKEADIICDVCKVLITEGTEIEMTSHTWGTGVITTPASCNAEGVMTYTCTECEATKTENIAVDANAHTANSGIVTIPASCNAEGEITYSCTVCGDILWTDSISMTDHTPASVGTVTTEPECEVEGMMTYFCEVCHAELRTEPIAPLEHDYERTVTPATCQREGEIRSTCTRCGDSHIIETLPITEHRWVAGEVITPAAIEAIGFSKSYCQICGAEGENMTIPALNPPSGGSGGGGGAAVIAPETDVVIDEPDVPLASALPFDDVKEDAWFREAVQYVYDNDLMDGTSDTIFNPHFNTTRGMIVTVLWRMENKPEASFSAAIFSDVAKGEWYSEAVAWAAENDIVTGYDGDLFCPNRNITRQEMAAILYRYANYKKYDVTGKSEILAYTDADDVHGYAVDAIKWAVNAKLIQGMDNGTLAPTGSASRAQAAAILMRFNQSFAAPENETK